MAKKSGRKPAKRVTKKTAPLTPVQELKKIERANKRKQVRLERYHHMLAMGFNAKDARRFRDRSVENIEIRVDTRQAEITKIRKVKRDDKQADQLARIRKAKQTAPAVTNKGRNKTRAGRLAEFKRWTGARNFPEWANDYIREANKDKKLDPFNSYGYRQFYYRYVNNRAESVVGLLADRDDS